MFCNLKKSVLLTLMELVDLFRGESQLGDDIGICGIAVERIGGGGNIEAVFLPETVEIILHMEAVHTLGRTVDMIILATVVAVDGKTVLIAVAHFGFAQGDKPIATGEGIDIHFVFVGVCTVQNLLPHLRPFPLEPIGDMGKFGLTLSCGELTVFFHKPALAAVFAENLRAFGGHPELGVTVGTLVKYFLQTLCPVGFRDADVVFQLIAVFVILHDFPDHSIDLIGGHLRHLFSGEDLAEYRAVRHFPLVLVGPEGGVQVIAVVGYDHQRNLVHLHQPAQGFRQERSGADGGVASFGVHAQNITVLDHPTDGLDQMNVVGELPGADGSDPGQQPRHHMITVDIYHIVHLFGVGHHGGQLEINERLVIAEDDVRRLQTLHIDGLEGIFLADKADFGQDPNEPGEPGRLTNGIFCGFVVFFPAVIYFHI